MTLVGERNIGACFKRPDGTTYTEWWLGSGLAWRMSADEWIRDKKFWDMHLSALGKQTNRLMCIVRNV